MCEEKPCPLVVGRYDDEIVLTFYLIVDELVPDDLHHKVEDDVRNVEDGDDLDLLVQAVEGPVLLVCHSLYKLQAFILSLVGMVIESRFLRESDKHAVSVYLGCIKVGVVANPYVLHLLQLQTRVISLSHLLFHVLDQVQGRNRD